MQKASFSCVSRDIDAVTDTKQAAGIEIVKNRSRIEAAGAVAVRHQRSLSNFLGRKSLEPVAAPAQISGKRRSGTI